MIDFELLKKILQENNSFLITTHVNPDADAIGSELALFYVVQHLGKEAKIINYSETPYYLTFLDEQNVIEKFNEQKHSEIFNEYDVLIAVDFNRASRIIKMETAFRNSKKLKICIDHHEDAENFVDHLFIDTSYSATGQILYDFISSTGIAPITLPIANNLYAAIMTDTGSFRFDRTTPVVHRIAAHLLETGVNPQYIYNKIYDESKPGKVKLLGTSINSLELFGDENRLAVMTIMQSDLDSSGALETDTDGFVNLCMSIENVKMGMLFLELKDGFKVSLRSKGELSVHQFASEFGGGGHRNASGIRFRNNTLEEMRIFLIEKAIKYLNNSRDEDV